MVKVWEKAYIPANQLVGYQCAWKGCEAHFKGDLPYGWVWLVTYRAPTPEIMACPIPQKDMPRDTVLCPKHNHALERLLVELPHPELSGPPAGSA